MTVAAVLVVIAGFAPIPAAMRVACAAVALAWVGGPAATIVVGALVLAAVAHRRMTVRARVDDRDADEELLAVDLIALGVSGGLSFAQAVGIAASTVTGTPHLRLRAIQRRLTAGSGSLALDGPLGEVARVADRSAASGAPLGPGLRAVAASVRSDRAAVDSARLARLPVRLLFPLALLILPGFILLAVGPTVISGLSRLSL